MLIRVAASGAMAIFPCIRAFAAVVLAFGMISVAAASNTGMAHVFFPVDLGPAADPSAIPISCVPVWSNYDYGIHEIISAPRLGFAGEASEVARLDENLLSRIGIAIVPDDPTQVPQFPITIRHLPPADAAASVHPPGDAIRAAIWCLLLTTPGSDLFPVVVHVDSPDPDLKKFSGAYQLESDSLKLLRDPIPGCVPVRDVFGVTRLHFTDRKPEKASSVVPVQAPGFVPVTIGGGSQDQGPLTLRPFWTHDPQQTIPAALAWFALPRGMNALSAKKNENANPLHASAFSPLGEISAATTILNFQLATPIGTSPATPEHRELFAAACFSYLLSEAAGTGADDAGRWEIEVHFHEYPPTDSWQFLAAEGWEKKIPPNVSPYWTRTLEISRNAETSTLTLPTIAGHTLHPASPTGWEITATE